MRVILSFKSRSQTLQCANMLRANNYPSSLADTPMSLHGSCTLSVHTSYDGFVFISSYLRNFSAFIGAYKTEEGKLTRIF